MTRGHAVHTFSTIYLMQSLASNKISSFTPLIKVCMCILLKQLTVNRSYMYIYLSIIIMKVLPIGINIKAFI